MKTSNEMASTKTTALAAISNLGAINAEQTLSFIAKVEDYKKSLKKVMLLFLVVLNKI